MTYPTPTITYNGEAYDLVDFFEEYPDSDSLSDCDTAGFPYGVDSDDVSEVKAFSKTLSDIDDDVKRRALCAAINCNLGCNWRDSWEARRFIDDHLIYHGCDFEDIGRMIINDDPEMSTAIEKLASYRCIDWKAFVKGSLEFDYTLVDDDDTDIFVFANR